MLVLPARSARTLYNVADALAPRGGEVDVAPYVEARLRERGPATARRVRRLLAWIEWQPLLELRGRRSFSWLPREERRERLRALERGRSGRRRRVLGELRAWIEEALAQSSGA